MGTDTCLLSGAAKIDYSKLFYNRIISIAGINFSEAGCWKDRYQHAHNNVRSHNIDQEIK
ncbi:MAG: hypothetical protein BGO56_00775 [Sphingobacteriales bacterium 48-107]|nr:MAG: hypothetical protein BGO56_00775 [Sphingobacteriales bacterium 48-107]